MRIILITLIILLVLSTFRLFSFNGGIGEFFNLSLKLQQIHDKNQLLDNQNKLLVKEVFDLKQGLDAVESLARSQLGLVAKDEVFVKLLELQPVIKAQPQVENSAIEAVENPQPIEIH